VSKKTIDRLAWDRPEWWTVLVAVGAWLALAAQALARHRASGLGVELGHWLLMVLAMMLPLQLAIVRSVAFNSLRRRRHVAIATFLAGYLAVWTLAGLPAIALAHLAHGPLIAAGAFVFAAITTSSATHAWAIDACHASRPLAPSGLAATRDAFTYGALIGCVCILACWPLMVACTLADHALVALVGGAIVGFLERRAFRPRVRAAVLVIVALAVWQLAKAF